MDKNTHLISPNFSEGKSNQIFITILFFSALFHTWCYQRINELYDSTEISAIEMSIEDISQPGGRDIPTPRFKPKMPPMAKAVSHQLVTPKLLPAKNPMEIEHAKIDLPDTLMEKITDPDIADTLSIAASDYHQVEGGARTGSIFGSSKEYFDMVRVRIEGKKKYPRQAKAMQQEGRVTVQFTIDLSGEIMNISVVKSSGYRRLDQAAIKSVKESSPLPSMPRSFFYSPETIELTIVFELY